MVIENVAKHLPADGHVTITNNTKFHNFFNGVEQARIHLVVCVLENPLKKIMTEITKGLFGASKEIFENKAPLLELLSTQLDTLLSQ